MLTGQTVLLVEDDYFLANDLAASLRSAGASILGPIGSLEEALERVVCEATPDLAVLDINLRDHAVYPLVDQLTARGVPVLFVTGYEATSVPDRYRHVPMVQKPATAADIIPLVHELTVRRT